MSANEKREDDLVPMRIVGLAMDPFNNSPIVLLRDKRPLFEIIAAMRKKRSAQQNEQYPKDDILQHDDFSQFSSTDDASETDDLFDADDLDDASDGIDTSDVSDAHDVADDVGTADDLSAADDLGAADDLSAAGSEEDVLGGGTLDDLPSVSVEGESASVEEKSLEESASTKQALRADEVERMLAAMEGGPEVRVSHPSSRTEDDEETPSDSTPDTSASLDDAPLRSVGRDVEDDDERRALLPIWIGEAEANAIATELLGIATPRPMTHDLLKQAIAAMGGAVNRVIVTDIRENTFYAAIEVRRSAEEVISLDARPSDALALALRFGADIFVHDRVLEKTQQRENPSRQVVEEMDEVQQERWKDQLQRRNEDSLDKYKQ